MFKMGLIFSSRTGNWACTRGSTMSNFKSVGPLSAKSRMKNRFFPYPVMHFEAGIGFFPRETFIFMLIFSFRTGMSASTRGSPMSNFKSVVPFSAKSRMKNPKLPYKKTCKFPLDDNLYLSKSTDFFVVHAGP
jgi:hypothetical protein